ncbi:hypothetical protein BaRGS_00006169 [Batillaria attramentaria]|uniref:Ig-like domain-containing protein n=1 Tax=Batillaria attramentaria TaxID=370345 RepID=A0ABD0LSQ1_9CAEN
MWQNSVAGHTLLLIGFLVWQGQVVGSLSIRNCNNGKLDIKEAENNTVECRVSSSSRANISWSLVAKSGKTTDQGSCQGNVCTSPLSPDITAERSSFRFFLKFYEISRVMAGTTLIVEEVYRRVRSANCTLDVDVGQSSACGKRRTYRTWGSLQPAGSRRRTYRTRGSEEGYTFRLAPGESLEPLTKTPALEQYTDASTGKQYYKGNCSFSWRLPVLGENFNIPVKVYPGDWVYYRSYYAVEEPPVPTHNCQNLTFIPEDGEVFCVCTTSSLGSPEGRLIWFSGDTVLAAGDYGVRQLQFPSNKVDRRHDGKEKKCQLDWIVKKEVYTTKRVARSTQTTTASFLIVCTVLGVNPLTPEMIQWGGLCQGQMGFTCVVSMTTPVNGGKEVTCTAFNSANNDHSAQASIELSPPSRVPGQTTDQGTPDAATGDGMAAGIAVGFWTVFGVAAAVVAIVLTVLWRKGRLEPCRRGNPNNGPRTSEQEENTPTPTDLNTSSVPVSSTPQGDAPNLKTQQQDDRVYVNLNASAVATGNSQPGGESAYEALSRQEDSRIYTALKPTIKAAGTRVSGQKSAASRTTKSSNHDYQNTPFNKKP